jgi:ornithine cyclodeaminase
MHQHIHLTWLNGPDIERLALTDQEILDAVEAGLMAQGRGETVIEPRMHLVPDSKFNGHFNVLRGYVAPLKLAGVKIVGDFVDNYKRGLPSEMALLNLFDPTTGMPVAILDATAITDMRTGALTALGAKYLGPRRPRRLGHVGARGTAYWNVRLLDRVCGFQDIRVHSRRPRAARPSPRGCRPISASPSPRSTAGRPASTAPTSWSRPRGWSGPSRCSRPPGSRRARWSFPTAP